MTKQLEPLTGAFRRFYSIAVAKCYLTRKSKNWDIENVQFFWRIFKILKIYHSLNVFRPGDFSYLEILLTFDWGQFGQALTLTWFRNWRSPIHVSLARRENSKMNAALFSLESRMWAKQMGTVFDVCPFGTPMNWIEKGSYSMKRGDKVETCQTLATIVD